MGELSIRVRLALAYTVIFGLLLGLWSVALYRLAAARLYALTDAQLQDRYEALRPLFNVSQGTVSALVDERRVEQFAYPAAYAIFDQSGQVLHGSTLSHVFGFPHSEAANQALAGRTPIMETLSLPDGHRVRVLNSPMTGSDGRAYLFRVGLLLDQSDEDLRQLALILLLLVPLVVLAGGTLGWWMARRALDPVAQITGAAQRITATNLAERLPLRGTQDELDLLSTTLNEMIARLQHSFDHMSQFISNVSHELRTPLAAVRGSCEVALRSTAGPEELRGVLAGNIEELDRLAKTVSNLLALARAEAGQVALNCRPENLSELVRDSVESVRVLAAARGIQIDCRIDGEIMAHVDPEHVLRLLINLLDNAIKYNREHGQVEVGMDTQDSWAIVSIRDTGIGISPEDLPRIFDRFYRGQTEVPGGASGTGLGLGLARWVAVAHGGRIEVQSEPGQGSTFRVWLPLISRA